MFEGSVIIDQSKLHNILQDLEYSQQPLFRTILFISYTKQLVDISLAITFAGMMFGVCINYMVQDSPHESHTLMAKNCMTFKL
jgi:hypothetical protein